MQLTSIHSYVKAAMDESDFMGVVTALLVDCSQPGLGVGGGGEDVSASGGCAAAVKVVLVEVVVMV